MTVSTLEIGLEEARFKAAGTVAVGLRTLEFYAAAFSSTPDANGDIIDPHAFDGWLETFYAKGQNLPISWNHAAILDGLDPTDVVGYAPADPQHVWVDDYGLRIKALLDIASEKGKAVEWQIENGLLLGASLAFEVPPGGIVKKSGYTLITEISNVREAGPVPNPANQEAVLLWLKSAGLLEAEADVPYMSVAEFRETFLTENGDQTESAEEEAEVETESAEAVQEILSHASASSGIQTAHDALVRAGAKCATVGSAKSENPPEEDSPVIRAAVEAKSVEEFVQEVRRSTAEELEADTVAARQRKLRLLETSLP